MTKKPTTTEEMLATGKGISLSSTERDDMKSTLLSYAEFHGVKNKSTKSIFVLSNVWMRSAASASLALVLFIGTGYASASSLPGDFLYPMKTNVVEEVTAATKLTPMSQLQYSHERYEARLLELHTLSKKGVLSAASLKDSQTEISELSVEINQLMAIENNINDEVALELISDILSMSIAIESIIFENNREVQLDVFERITDSIEVVQDEEVMDMLQNSTSTIEAYIQYQLSKIGEELAENDIEGITTIRVADYLEDADLALQDEDYGAVLNQLVDAVTLINSREYANDTSEEVLE